MKAKKYCIRCNAVEVEGIKRYCESCRVAAIKESMDNANAYRKTKVKKKPSKPVKPKYTASQVAAMAHEQKLSYGYMSAIVDGRA